MYRMGADEQEGLGRKIPACENRYARKSEGCWHMGMSLSLCVWGIQHCTRQLAMLEVPEVSVGSTWGVLSMI